MLTGKILGSGSDGTHHGLTGDGRFAASLKRSYPNLGDLKRTIRIQLPLLDLPPFTDISGCGDGFALFNLRGDLLVQGEELGEQIPFGAEAGGGWVNDFEPETEFQETVNQSKTILKAVALAETFVKS